MCLCVYMCALPGNAVPEVSGIPEVPEVLISAHSLSFVLYSLYYRGTDHQLWMAHVLCPVYLVLLSPVL